MSFKTYRLEELLEIQNGFAFNSKQFSAEGDIGLIRIRDLKQGLETETRYTGEYDKKYIVKSGDYLIGMDGEFGCYEWKGSDSLLNQRVCRLENFSDSLYSRYLFYGINKYLKDIEDVTGFTTVKHISAKQIKQIEFPLPSLSEQKRIVAILDEAFAGIDQAIVNTEKNLAFARELFESYLNNILAQKGEGWKEEKLGDISAINYGYTAKASGEEVGPKFLRITDIQDKGVNWETVPFCAISAEDHIKHKLLEGDLVFARTGATTGKSYLLQNPPDVVCASYLIRVRVYEGMFNPDFLQLYFQTKQYWDEIASGISGSAQGGFNASKLGALVIPVPPINEQIEISKKASELYSEIKSLESISQQKLIALNELKQSLLHQAFSGELTADDIREEAAA